MFGVNNSENKSSDTPQCSRYESDNHNEVFNDLINLESTTKKRKVDKSRFPRLSSFNMSTLRLSSSTNSEASKVWSEVATFNTDEEMDELRCSPMVPENSPVFGRKTKCSSYTLTPHKPQPFNKEFKLSDDTYTLTPHKPQPFNKEFKLSDDSLHEPLRISESFNDSHTSHDEASDSLDIVMAHDPEQMKSEVGTPHGLICPPAECPQRPSKIRKSEASFGGERSCRLLFTKSEDAMKDAITSYGCAAGIGVSQTSEKPITPTDFGIELKQGALNFDVQASGSKTLEPKIPEESDKDDNSQEKMETEKLTEKENFDKEFTKEALNIQLLGKNIENTVISAKVEIEHVIYAKVKVEPNTLSDKVENNTLGENKNLIDSGFNNDSEKEKSSENKKMDTDESNNLSSTKSENALNNAILENHGKTVLGLSTPILKIDVDYPQILSTPTHDQGSSKSNNLISIPFAAPTMSSDKYLGNSLLSAVQVLLTPTDSPIHSPGSSSSCSCSCIECDLSPPSAAKAKTMSQTIESSIDIDVEIQMPKVIDTIMDPINVENKDQEIQENIIESSNKIDVLTSNKIDVIWSSRNESLTSTPKDLTPHSIRSNVTAISGISPLPSSTPRPRHKHKHDHHHHHHHRHHQSSMHHLTVHSNSHHHMTSDGDILITSTPMNRQNSVDELFTEEISDLGSNIDSCNSDMYGKQSRFVMSDLCGSDQSASHYTLGKIVLNSESQNFSSGGGAMYITGKIGSGSLEVPDSKESVNNSADQCKLHLGPDVSPDVWMMDESLLLPRRASSVDETLFRVLSQDSPICLSLN